MENAGGTSHGCLSWWWDARENIQFANFSFECNGKVPYLDENSSLLDF